MQNLPEPQKSDPASTSNPLEELRTLTLEPGFIYTFAKVAANNAFIIAREEKVIQNVPTQKELSLVARQIAQAPVDLAILPDEDTLKQQQQRLNDTLNRIHSTAGEAQQHAVLELLKEQIQEAERTHDLKQPPSFKAPLPGQALIEAFFYTGDGAYDFQFLDMASHKYGLDAKWLAENTGLSIDRLVRVVKRLERLQQCRFVLYLQAPTHHVRLQRALAIFSFSRSDVAFLSSEEFDSFIDRFSIVLGPNTDPLQSKGAINELEFRPVLQFDTDHFFIPSQFKLAESIFESPSYWMREDTLYADTASHHKGEATEAIAEKLLNRVFGAQVYKNVQVKRGHHDVAEIDVLAWVRDRIILVQAKSKGLTVLSRLGDDESIRVDFDQAIQEAFGQGVISRAALLDPAHSILDAKGNPLPLPNKIAEVYLLCLSLSPFPVVQHMLDSFLNKEAADPYPVAMSVFDLDIVTTYLDQPLEFLHYIHHRVESAESISGHNEVTWLAHYLTMGKLPSQVKPAVLLSDYARLIDEDFPNLRNRRLLLARDLGFPTGARPGLFTPEQLRVLHDTFHRLRARINNQERNHLIRLLEGSPEPFPVEAFFMLYDLSTDQLEYLIQKIQECRESCQGSAEAVSLCLQLEGGERFIFLFS